MTINQNLKKYDLEERTYIFATNIRSFLKKIRKTYSNIEDSKQLIRASGSVAANYVEANDSLSKKEFIYRIKICRKEAKESRLFLRLLDTDNNESMESSRAKLSNEATELMKIFGAILSKSQ